MYSDTIKAISPATLHEWQAAGHNFYLLDVREADEVAICTLPHAHHIPMNRIPLAQQDLPDDVPIVVYCHHGIRSFQVALFLERAGFDSLYNLQGGIDAYAQEIDPSLARY